MKDKRVWNQFHQELNPKLIEEVILINGAENIKLNKSEKEEFIQEFSNATFESSNRERKGSTPDGHFLLNFKNNTEVSVSYMIGGKEKLSPRFELSPRHLDPETQFFIESEELSNFIEARLSK